VTDGNSCDYWVVTLQLAKLHAMKALDVYKRATSQAGVIENKHSTNVVPPPPHARRRYEIHPEG